MANQTYYEQERGDHRVRDYTQESPRSLDRRLGLRGIGNINADLMGRRLVWASLGLGLLEILIPGRVQKLAGVRNADHSKLIRFLGIREINSAFLILMQARPLIGVWARVAGDVMDLGLLGSAFNTRRVNKKRLAGATAFILGVTAIDILAALSLNRLHKKEQSVSTLTKADLSGRTESGGFKVSKSVTINAAPDTLYQFWHNFENLPKFMYHLESVYLIDDRRSAWTAKAPAGRQVSWEAEITEDRPNEMIAWRSVANADVPNSGVVRFEPAPAGRGTVVRVEIEYRPPGGVLGKTVALLFGEEPGQQVKGDLSRFKQVIETGEVVRSEGSPQGLGQRMQRPARPLTDKNRLDNKMTGEDMPGKQPRTVSHAEVERTAREQGGGF